MSRHIVFCADLQARESVYKYDRDLRYDDIAAIEQVVRYCNDRDNPCDALVLGGDQVDSPNISDNHVIQLRRVLRGCTAPVYYIDGNHEKGFRRLELEGGAACVAHPLEDNPFEFCGLKVMGYNWRSRRDWEKIKDEIQLTDILVLHGFADQAVIELGLATATAGNKDFGDFNLGWFDGKCKLCLMGDIHKYLHFKGEKGTEFYYPGSMWMHKANEPTDKYFITVDQDLNVTQIPLETRPFIKADIYTEQDMSDTLERIKEARATGPKDPRIQKPRVHLDIYADHSFDEEIDVLRTTAHVFPRMKPSETVSLIADSDTQHDSLNLKEAISTLVDKNEQELRSFLTDIFDTGVDNAMDSLRNRLGVK